MDLQVKMAIMSCLKAHRAWRSTGVIARLAGVPWNTRGVRRYLRALHEAGLVELNTIVVNNHFWKLK